MRIVVISAHMGPYHWARARAAAHSGADCVFLELSSRQDEHPWTGYDAGTHINHISLFKEPLEELSSALISKSLLDVLDRIDPSVVFIPGYHKSYFWKSAAWAHRRNRSAVLLFDSWAGNRRRYWPKEFAKRLLVRHLFDAAFISGERSAHYIATLGISPQCIWRGVTVVDNEHFAQGAAQARSGVTLREQMHLPAEYGICVTRYIPEKNLPMLLKAFGLYRRDGGRWELVLVGDGPMRAELHQRIQAAGLDKTVHLWPWTSYDTLPALYALAKVLVLPSASETWGLVVNEAMAAGLPVLVSDRCGCAPDLCRVGTNGFVFDHRDAVGLSKLMGKMSDGSLDLQAMGRASQQIISGWTPETWARSLLDCADTVAAFRRTEESSRARRQVGRRGRNSRQGHDGKGEANICRVGGTAASPLDRRVIDRREGRKCVLLFQSLLSHYRVGIFELVSKSPTYDYVFCLAKGMEPGYRKVVIDVPSISIYRVPCHVLVLGKHRLHFQVEHLRAALERRVDVIIYGGDFHVPSDVIGMFLARLAGKKVILYGHGVSRRGPYTGLMWLLRRLMFRLVNAVLLYGQREYGYYQSLGWDMSKFFMTHNALDTRVSKAAMAQIRPGDLARFQRERGLADRVVLIFTGRLQREKRLDLALEAMPAILRQLPQAKLVIIGNGPELPRLKQQAGALGIEEAVDFPGEIYEEQELAKYYLSSTLAVSPGPMGLMVNHAFFYGVPVVTSSNLWAHGPEIAMVKEGQTGAFFREGDSASLAQEVLRLLQDPPALAHMGAHCKKLIEEQYNETRMAAVFDEVVTYALAH